MRRGRLAVLVATAFCLAEETAAINPEVHLAGDPLCISSPTGWNGAASGAAVSSIRIAPEGAFIYQPGFYPDTWSGSLRKFQLLAGGGLAASALWDAGELLTGPAGSRTIYTMKTGSVSSTVPFHWNALGEEQKAALGKSPQTNEADGNGEKRLNFLRGDRAEESRLFRKRARLLGDIVHSTPVYVGAPGRNEQGAAYLAFARDNASRHPMVYVGANDGMLHAFDADDGKEAFAYMPNALLPRLPALTHPGYRHQPYVDGPMHAGEALLDGQWKTILISGFGGGAQGVFALDVTDPSVFGKTRGALFEFTDADDPDMGNLLTTPLIARLRISSKASRYFAVVASGVNNYKDDGVRSDGNPKFNTDAAAALFLLALDKPASAAWRENVNYYKFRLPGTDASLPQGLSAPALVADGSGNAVRAYAGDLQGNLWRFDFSGGVPWPKAFNPVPLFVAKDAHGKRQAISTQPRVIFAPGGGHVVLFGTGKFMEDSDTVPAGFDPQSFYGIFDDGQRDHTVSGRGELAARTAERSDAGGYVVTGRHFRYGSGLNGKKGWYLDFPDAGKTGERVAGSAVLTGDRLFFNTLIPDGAACTGRTYELDGLSGLSSSELPTGYVYPLDALAPPLPVETGIEVGGRTPAGGRIVTRRVTVIEPGRADEPESVPSDERHGKEVSKEVQVRAGRFSWREIHDWKERHSAQQK